MGQKINPIGLRVGIIRDWEAKWYAEKDFASLLHEDLKIRKFIDNELKEASVSHVEIERAANRINIAIHTGKPGMVIGKGGSEIEKVDLDARLVAENIARQLENRASFRRVQKQAITRAMKLGAKG
ncbi:KH domain-containing protein, partial [Staphylococcus aureus]|nr:KH domain-containing protein [Staphylococcus aureus]